MMIKYFAYNKLAMELRAKRASERFAKALEKKPLIFQILCKDLKKKGQDDDERN